MLKSYLGRTFPSFFIFITCYHNTIIFSYAMLANTSFDHSLYNLKLFVYISECLTNNWKLASFYYTIGLVNSFPSPSLYFWVIFLTCVSWFPLFARFAIFTNTVITIAIPPPCSLLSIHKPCLPSYTNNLQWAIIFSLGKTFPSFTNFLWSLLTK